MSPRAVEVFEALAMRAHPTTLEARCRTLDLAMATGTTVDAADAAVRELTKAGHVRRLTRGGSPAQAMQRWLLSGEGRL